MRFTQAEIQSAVDGVLSKKYPTVYAAEKATGVSRQTITARLNGTQPAQEAHGFEQKLTLEEEKRIVEWILLEDRAGQAPSYARLRSFAMDILESRHASRDLGLTWHNQFIGRHPDIKATFARKVEASRIKSCNKTAIQGFFDCLKSIIREFKMPASRIWNMDESGLQLGDSGHEKVLTASDTSRPAIVEQPMRKKWTTSIEAISAAGAYIDPLLIFSGIYIHSNQIPRHLDRLGCVN